MVNAQNILDLARNYRNLSKLERAELELRCREYPWFQLLHILLAKSNKNENSSLYDGALKKAAAYAGDRAVMYDIMHDMLAFPGDKIPVFTEDLTLKPLITETENLMVDSEVESVASNPLNTEKNQSELLSESSIISEAIIPEEKTVNPEEEIIREPGIITEEVQSMEEDSSSDKKDLAEEKIPEPETAAEKLETIEQESSTNIEDLEKDSVENVETPTIEAGSEDAPQIEEAIIEEPEELTEINEVIKNEESAAYTILYDPLIELAGLTPGPKKEKEMVPVVSVYDPEKELSQYTEQEVEEEDHDFSYWLDHYNEAPVKQKPVKEDAGDLLAKFLQEKPSISRQRAEFYKPENMARKSEELSLDLVSSSLAELFVRQGHISKAIEIYKKLMLQNPANSAFFAARIQELELK